MSAEKNDQSAPSAMVHLGLFLLRVIVGVSMIVHHSWAFVYTGWRYFWFKEDWLLVDGARALNLPYPVIWCVFVSIILFIGSIFLVVGLLGRITSGALLVTAVGFLYIVLTYEDWHYMLELAVAYAAIYLALFVMGSGKIALDSIFSFRALLHRRKKLASTLQDLD